MLKAFKIQRDLMETQVEADVFVLAAGANSSKVAAQVGLTKALGCQPEAPSASFVVRSFYEQVGVNVPVYPLKGHMATAKLPGLKRNIYSPRCGQKQSR